MFLSNINRKLNKYRFINNTSQNNTMKKDGSIFCRKLPILTILNEFSYFFLLTVIFLIPLNIYVRNFFQRTACQLVDLMIITTKWREQNAKSSNQHLPYQKINHQSIKEEIIDNFREFKIVRLEPKSPLRKYKLDKGIRKRSLFKKFFCTIMNHTALNTFTFITNK